MKHLLFSIGLFSAYSFGQISFQETYGGTGFDHGLSVQQTTDGGYIALGQTESFGNGLQDLYLVKTDENGVELWSMTYGTPNVDWGISVKQTSDGGYILCGGWDGTTLDSLVLIKTDDTGNEEWNYRFSGSIDREVGQSVVETADGGFIAVGFASAFPNEDVYVVKTNNLGIEQWNHIYSGPGKEIATSVRQSSDLGYYVFGVTDSYGAGMRDFYLMKLNPAGDSLWTKTYGTVDDEVGTSMHVNTDGSIIMVGHEYFSGGDIYVVKADQAGTIIWDQYYGGTGWDFGYSIKQTTDGGYVLSGRRDNTNTGGTEDMYCLKIDQTGGITWEYSYPLGIISDAYSIEQTTDGGYIMAGTMIDTMSFSSDMVLLKIPSSGYLEIDDMTDVSIEINAYPNPFVEYTIIDVRDDNNRSFDLNILASNGALVFHQEDIAGGQVRLDRQHFSQGVHFFEITMDNQVIGTGKLIAR